MPKHDGPAGVATPRQPGIKGALTRAEDTETHIGFQSFGYVAERVLQRLAIGHRIGIRRAAVPPGIVGSAS